MKNRVPHVSGFRDVGKHVQGSDRQKPFPDITPESAKALCRSGEFWGPTQFVLRLERGCSQGLARSAFSPWKGTASAVPQNKDSIQASQGTKPFAGQSTLSDGQTGRERRVHFLLPRVPCPSLLGKVDFFTASRRDVSPVSGRSVGSVGTGEAWIEFSALAA